MSNSILESILPEEIRATHTDIMNKIGVKVFEKQKTLVMVEIFPSDLKKIDNDDERITRFNEQVYKIFEQSFPEMSKDFELSIRAYGFSEEKWNKLLEE